MDDFFPDKLLFSEAGYKGDSLLVRIEEDFRYISSKGVITVKKDFISDGASVPRIWWSFFSRFGPYFKGALVHDWLYSEHNTVFNRKESDLIFKEAMFNLKVNWVSRELIYNAVRMGGFKSFRGTKK
jgi:hypothetical protein